MDGDAPMQTYASQRRVLDQVVAENMQSGATSETVAKVIVTAATDSKPKMRYPAGALAGRVSVLRRFAPAGAFDKSVRKLNRMTS